MIDRRLRVLQAIARHGTVTKAAEVCRLTPSAVSHQMQSLARDLEVTLLEPHGRLVRLTPAAHTLLRHAATLAAAWESAQADLAAHRDAAVTGTVRIAGFSTAAAVVAPRALARIQARHPQLQVQLRESEPARAFDLLAAGEVDIAVVVATPSIPTRSDPAFEQHELYAEPLDTLLSPRHPLADRDGIALLEMAGDRWIVGSPDRAYHQLVILACTTAGFRPEIAHYADEWDTGAALVAADLGVALVPRLADLPSHHDTRRIPVTGTPLPTRQILLAIRAGSAEQPGIAAGIEALRLVCRIDLPELAHPGSDA